MNIPRVDPVVVMVGGATFLLVFALWGMVTILWAKRRSDREAKIKQRLDSGYAPTDGVRTLRLWHENAQGAIDVPDDYRASSIFERLEWLRRDAGFTLSAMQILLLLAGFLGSTVAVLYMVTGNLVSAVGVSAALLVFFWFFVNKRIAKRTARFEQQLVDGLELSARALRAGHPVLGSFQLIAEEVPEPVGTIFGDICQQHEMGVSIDEALMRAATLSRNADMQLFTASLSIQMRTGGNLADVVEGIAKVIRQRMRLSRRFRVLTAQTQLSKRVLLGLPVILFGILQAIRPSYLNPLFNSSTGNMLLVIAISGLLLGWYVMNKMASLHS